MPPRFLTNSRHISLRQIKQRTDAGLGQRLDMHIVKLCQSAPGAVAYSRASIL
jgi:hypothetical protein